jgi:hypothetical protein
VNELTGFYLEGQLRDMIHRYDWKGDMNGIPTSRMSRGDMNPPGTPQNPPSKGLTLLERSEVFGKVMGFPKKLSRLCKNKKEKSAFEAFLDSGFDRGKEVVLWWDDTETGIDSAKNPHRSIVAPLLNDVMPKLRRLDQGERSEQEGKIAGFVDLWCGSEYKAYFTPGEGGRQALVISKTNILERGAKSLL